MKDEIIVGPENSTHRLILLHGWGADAEDLIPLGRELIGGLKQVEVVSLSAPHLHPEGLGRQWYELYPHNWLDALKATKELKSRLVKKASFQIPLENTVALGFSQGGAMALASGCDLPLAGLIVCSGYMHPNWTIPKQTPPIFLTHGANDQVVPVEASQQIYNLFKASKLDIEKQIFQGGHEISNELISNMKYMIKKWIN